MQVVSRDIRRILTQRASHFNLVLDDVSITNLTFSREYTHAVEAKQVSQQEAERAKFIVWAQSLHFSIEYTPAAVISAALFLHPCWILDKFLKVFRLLSNAHCQSDAFQTCQHQAFCPRQSHMITACNNRS